MVQRNIQADETRENEILNEAHDAFMKNRKTNSDQKEEEAKQREERSKMINAMAGIFGEEMPETVPEMDDEMCGEIAQTARTTKEEMTCVELVTFINKFGIYAQCT